MNARKPRLTEQMIADLAIAAQVLADEADYLADAVKQHSANEALQGRLADKHRSIERSREWLTRFLDAVRARRAAGDDTDQENNDA